MTPKQVVDYFGCGDITTAAKKIDVTYQAIKQWLDKGKVPRGRQFELQDLSNGKLKVALEYRKKAA